jgi:hypothetical protein
MDVLEYWILDGKLLDNREVPTLDIQQRQMILTQNYVKVTISAAGTQVKWAQFARNWASLFYVQGWLSLLPAPFTFNFYNAGWFTEVHNCVETAHRRLQALVSGSDIKISSRTFATDLDITEQSLPEKLQEALRHGRAPLEETIVMAVDFERDRSVATYVGPKSMVAQVWGRSQVSFPLQTGNSYDRTVSQGYYTAIRDDRVVRNRVLASMLFPDGELKWCSYERLIFPNGMDANGLPSVRVLVGEIPSTNSTMALAFG